MFKVSPSSSSKIMGQKGLGKTGETYCEQWVKESIYKKRKDFYSKYTDKGNSMEQDAIDYVAKAQGWGLVAKNQERLEDFFMIGTPDLVLNDKVVDIKNSWDCFTFPLFDSEPNKDYYWQLQCYMALTEKTKAELIYVLMDAPEHLIDKEALFESRNRGEQEVSMDIYDEVKERMTYSHLPDHLRIKIFQIERNESDIDLIRERVEMCRSYISKLTSAD